MICAERLGGLIDILQGGMSAFSAKERQILIEEGKRRRRTNGVAAVEEEEDVAVTYVCDAP